MVLFFGNNMTKYSKDLYKNYLIASSIKYSGLGLSEVFSKALSHDTISRWLKKQKICSIKDIWSELKKQKIYTKASIQELKQDCYP